MSATPQTAAAWYPDPSVAGQLRWWDGSAWTEHVHVSAPSVEQGREPHPVELIRDDARWQIYPDRTSDYQGRVLDSAEIQHHRHSQVMLALLIGGGLVVASAISVWIVVVGIVVGIAYGIATARFGGAGSLIVAEHESICRERGLEAIGGGLWGDRRARLTPGDLGPLQDELKASGFWSIRHVGVGARGPTWPAAPDTHLVELSLGKGEDSTDVLVVRVRLSSAVATRFHGMRLTFASKFDNSSRYASTPRRWKELALERDAVALGFRAHVAPEQDPIAAMELLDPAFLMRLAERAGDLRTMGITVALIGGCLIVSGSGSPLQHACWHRYRRAAGKSSIAAYAGCEGIVDTMVQVASDLHRRVEHEYL